MSYEEICEVLEISGKEADVFLPNEIFHNLRVDVNDSSHIAYAYSYMYLIHFLYRNCKYLGKKQLLDSHQIKEILGYSKSNRTMNYITKKGGVLDEKGYTKTTKDFPVNWKRKESNDERLRFLLASDYKRYLGARFPLIPKMFSLKYPVLAFQRGEQSEETETSGTFYSVKNTHSVPFEVFLFCMSKKELGVIVFYLYSWIKHKNDTYTKGYDVSLTKLSDETGIQRRTLIKYMDLLKGYRMIEFIHNQEYFVLGAFEGDRKATTYISNEIQVFSEEFQLYQKMGVQLCSEYFQMKAEQKMKTDMKKVDIPLLDLPF